MATFLVTSVHYPGNTWNYFLLPLGYASLPSPADRLDAFQRRYALEDSAGLRYFSWDDSGLGLPAEQLSHGLKVGRRARRGLAASLAD